MRGRAGRALAVIAAIAAAAAMAIGCEHRAQDEPAAGEAAGTIVATADYGAVPLLDVRAAPGQSVMRASPRIAMPSAPVLPSRLALRRMR